MGYSTRKLSKSLTPKQFDNGYWFAEEIKSFAKNIGIANSSKLRKDELEQLIKYFLRTGKIKNSKRRNIVKRGKKDIDIGLTKWLPVVNYTSNRKTKQFILNEVMRLIPDVKVKSGAWYRLNRWRDEQINQNKKITYGDLIRRFTVLNQDKETFKKIPVGRYINFLADFFAKENKATRQQALREWKKLKTLNIPKDYKSWKSYYSKSGKK